MSDLDKLIRGMSGAAGRSRDGSGVPVAARGARGEELPLRPLRADSRETP